MANFTVKVRTRTGVRSVDISAKSEQDARAHAASLGQIVSFRRHAGLTLGGALSPADRQIFFSRLAAMLASRVGTSEALGLIRDTFSGRIQQVAAKLLVLVETGEDLAGAFSRIGPPDFPEATVALIQAGARSGETWRAIKDAAKFEQELLLIKKSAAKGLWGGVAGFVFAGITTVASTLYVGPAIMESDMFTSLAESGTAIDMSVVDTIGYICGYLIGAIMAVGILGWFFGTVVRRIAPVAADNLILKIPFYKDLILSRNNFITLYGLGLLVRSGVRTEEALRLSAQGAPVGALRNDLNLAMHAVKTGKPWAQAMSTLHPTDKAALSCAVDREQIAETLDALANQYRELYGQRLGTFVPALNLLAALFLSIAGALLFAQSILPMLMATQGMM